MVAFSWYQFHALSVDQLYAILALRSKVFVLEQNCIYHDVDGKDISAMHLIGTLDNVVIAYLRLFPPTIENNFIIFGRVVTSNALRNRGYGKKLIQVMLDFCKENFAGKMIQCSAQLYLKNFYESFGFKAIGNAYDEDGIPHIKMQMNN